MISSFESNKESKKVDENGWVNWYRVSQKSLQNCDDVSWDACGCADAMASLFLRVSCLLVCLSVCLWVGIGCPVTFSPFLFRLLGCVSWVQQFEAKVSVGIGEEKKQEK